MSQIFRGEVTKVMEPKQGETKKGDKYAVREFLVRELNAQYPQEGKFKLFKTGEYTKYALEGFKPKVGDRVTVEYNLKTNEHKGRYFTDLDAWTITVDEASAAQPNIGSDEEDDDLPF